MADGRSSPSENTLSGRVRRYAQVSGAMGGLAARIAGARYLGIKIDRASHAAELKAALGGLKGPLMKVAQLLATIPDALPKEYAAELAQLQSQAPAMGWPFVRRRMAAELGPDWRERFADFELDAAAAASLGQVHRAIAKDGRALACKLQYPSIASAVEADLTQLRVLFGIYRRYDGAINPEQIYEELAERLREELDYGREARHMGLYRHMLRDEPGVHVPEVLPELSTGRLLTMTWLEGRPLLELANAPPGAAQPARPQHVPRLVRAVLRLRRDPRRPASRQLQRARRPEHQPDRLRLHPGVQAGARPGRDRPLLGAGQGRPRPRGRTPIETWGFSDFRKEVIDTLNLWAAFVYAPLMEDRPRLIEETNSGAYGRAVAFNVQKRLREIGGVTPPREFVLMDRAAIGLGSVFMHLKAEINWHQLFMGLIAGLRRRQARAPPDRSPPGPGPAAAELKHTLRLASISLNPRPILEPDPKYSQTIFCP